jgi:DNA-binding GntR family transcriptional regulator
MLVTESSKKRSLSSERAYKYLRDSIYDGHFKPGQVVTEDEVASAAGVSRTPVREAIRRASADGFLELEGFRRARVSVFTDEDTRDMFEIRAILEALAAERAATRITPEEIKQLEEFTDALEQVTRAGGPSLFRKFADFNNAFHVLLFKASRSRPIQQALEHLIEAPLILHKRYEGTVIGNLERTVRHHRAIITALKAGDPKWAHAETMAHLMSARSSLL